MKPPQPVPASLLEIVDANRRARSARAAASTVDALFFSLRERGEAALAEEPTQRRLAELSHDQIANLIEGLERVRPRCPAITDSLLLLLGDMLA